MSTVLSKADEVPSGNGSEPLLATCINSPSDTLQGWVVVDSLVDSMAMGGTRMTESVCEEEVKGLARAMTVKLALAGLPIGGAKAGIRAVPGRRDDLLRAFGRSVTPFLHGGIYLGCDQGTTHADRDLFFAEAGYDVCRDARATKLPTDWATFWRHMADVTGFGVSTATLTALRRRSSGEPCDVVVQGFGTVGRSVAKNLEAHGHRIVAIADVLGTVRRPEGLPVRELLDITDSAGTIDRSRLPDSVAFTGESEAWLDVPADVLILAAGGGAVRTDNVHRLSAKTVVEGGNLCCTEDAKKTMAADGVLLVPDVVANVGAAAVTGCVFTGMAPSGLPLTEMTAWLYDWVEERIRTNTQEVLEIAEGGSADPVGALLADRRKAK
jgi:glutamate dehydrogenase (NAD(P)+)